MPQILSFCVQQYIYHTLQTKPRFVMITLLDIKTMIELTFKYKRPKYAVMLLIYRIFGDEAVEHFISQEEL